MEISRPASGMARWIREPYCGLSHGAGAVAAIVALVLTLVFTTGGTFSYIGLSIYCGSMIAVFTASALAHSLHVSERTINWLNRADYASIFFLIAGTYAPLCLTVLRGPWGYTILSIEAALAVIGASAVLLTRMDCTIMSPLYVPMGWLILVAIVPVFRLMPLDAILWLIAGGVVYSVGAIIFIAEKPRLWPGRFGWHDLWHTLVLIGAGCQFIAVTRVAM